MLHVEVLKMIHAHYPLSVSIPSQPSARYAPLYHVFQRGNNHSYIYRSNSEKQHFLDLLEELQQRKNFDILYMVIMDNHFHMIFEDCGTCLPSVMRLLQWQYSWYYNHEHDRTGTNYEGRYHKIPIQSTGQLRHLAHYLVYNPVVANMVLNPVDYPWGTHRCIVNNAPTFVATNKLVQLFGPTIDRGRSRYISFMDQPTDGILDRKTCPAIDNSELGEYLNRILANIVPNAKQAARIRDVGCPKSLYKDRRLFMERALELNYAPSSVAHFLHCDYHLVRTVADYLKYQDKRCCSLDTEIQSDM
jgi:putative transposase